MSSSVNSNLYIFYIFCQYIYLPLSWSHSRLSLLLAQSIFQALGMILNAMTTIRIIITIMFHCFFHFSGKIHVFVFSLSFRGRKRIPSFIPSISRAWILSTLFCYTGIYDKSESSLDKCSRRHPISTQSWWMQFLASRTTLVCPWVGFHKEHRFWVRPYFSSGPSRLTWLICEMSG